MATQRMIDALNSQIQKEFNSSYIYIGMEAYFAQNDLDGFANFFHVQAQEERDHAYKLFNYVSRVGGDIDLGALDKPECNYESPLAAMEAALAHEKFITKSINELVDIALEERDHATVSFLNWYIDEQLEEEETAEKIVKKLKMIGDDARGLFMVDDELAQRVYTPLAAE